MLTADYIKGYMACVEVVDKARARRAERGDEDGAWALVWAAAAAENVLVERMRTA